MASLESEVNKILIDEIFPLVTKAFSSITSECVSIHRYWNDEYGKLKELFEDIGEKFVSDFKRYVEGTVKLQYETLTASPTEKGEEK